MEKTKNERLKYDQDVCGQELLKLVSRGSAIIAEILRLKDFIPEFYLNPAEEKKYANIIFDFTYFKNNFGQTSLRFRFVRAGVRAKLIP